MRSRPVIRTDSPTAIGTACRPAAGPRAGQSATGLAAVLGLFVFLAGAAVSVAGADGIDEFIGERAQSIEWALDMVHRVVVGFLGLGILASVALIAYAIWNFRDWLESYRSGFTIGEIVHDIRNRKIARDKLHRAGLHSQAAGLHDGMRRKRGDDGHGARTPDDNDLPPAVDLDPHQPQADAFAPRHNRDGWRIFLIVFGVLIAISAIVAAIALLPLVSRR